ncbi:MAG: acyltransferase [Pseudomonadota bacterium]
MTPTPAPAPAAARARLDEIDLAKGLAIALVVWGHIVAGDTPAGNAWYGHSKHFVYLFHMPFFMFLSGVVAGYGYRPVAGVAEWLSFAHKKLVRLLPAYVLFGVLIVVGKLVASRYVYVDNIPPSLWAGLWDVLTQPLNSGAKSLWFIYVLFLFYLTLHPWMALFGQRLLPLLAVGLVLQFVQAPEVLLLGTYAKFLLFFALGLGAGRHYTALRAALARWGAPSVLLFALALATVYRVPQLPSKLIAGLFSIPALLYLVGRLRAPAALDALRFLGRYSFVIYLLNTIFIGVIKAIGLKLTPWDGAAFLLFAPALFAGGLLLPVLTKRWLFARVAYLDRITQ